MTEDTTRLLELNHRFTEAKANVIVGHQSFTVVKGFRFARLTTHGWLLFRSDRDTEGRYFAEGCADDHAVRFIDSGATPDLTLPNVHHNGNGKTRARAELSTAILDAYGIESPQSERLLEALDIVAT